MKNDNKGSGMLQSMVAMMVVIVALTAFIGVLCYIQTDDTDVHEEDFEFVKELVIIDGEIVGDVEDDLAYLRDSNGYARTELRVDVVGNVNYSHFEQHYGEEMTNNVDSYKGTFNIASDDGRSLLANYEVVIWS